MGGGSHRRRNCRCRERTWGEIRRWDDLVHMSLGCTCARISLCWTLVAVSIADGSLLWPQIDKHELCPMDLTRRSSCADVVDRPPTRRRSTSTGNTPQQFDKVQRDPTWKTNEHCARSLRRIRRNEKPERAEWKSTRPTGIPSRRNSRARWNVPTTSSSPACWWLNESIRRRSTDTSPSSLT